jgi:hypothetical protein
VVSSYYEDRDVLIVELSYPVLERTVRLEVPILLIDDIASDYDPIDISVDGFLNYRQPDGLWRQLWTVKIVRDPTRVTAQVEVARAEQFQSIVHECCQTLRKSNRS